MLIRPLIAQQWLTFTNSISTAIHSVRHSHSMLRLHSMFDRVDTGNNVFNADTIEVNFNSGLTVNLPDDDAWTMGGTLNINLGLFTQTVLRGSPVLVTGTIHADGSSRITAAVDLSGDLVTEDAGTRVTLSGPSGIRAKARDS